MAMEPVLHLPPENKYDADENCGKQQQKYTILFSMKIRAQLQYQYIGWYQREAFQFGHQLERSSSGVPTKILSTLDFINS